MITGIVCFKSTNHNSTNPPKSQKSQLKKSTPRRSGEKKTRVRGEKTSTLEVGRLGRRRPRIPDIAALVGGQTRLESLVGLVRQVADRDAVDAVSGHFVIGRDPAVGDVATKAGYSMCTTCGLKPEPEVSLGWPDSLGSAVMWYSKPVAPTSIGISACQTPSFSVMTKLV